MDATNKISIGGIKAMINTFNRKEVFSTDDAYFVARLILDCEFLFTDGCKTEEQYLQRLQPMRHLALSIDEVENYKRNPRLYIELRASRLVKLATVDGNIIAFDAAINLGAKLLVEDKPIPFALKIFLSRVLTGEIKRPRQRGVHPKKNIHRDLVIKLAVDALKILKVKPTKNDATVNLSKSGCEIVSEVLLELGIPIGTEAVRKIYQNKESSLLEKFDLNDSND
jgi:hypothetical protein